MATIHPFRALRPPVERVAEVASPPYDVVNTEEARELAKGNPLSFFHVSRPEIDLAEGTDFYSDQVYQKAAENFEKLIRECPLENEATPSIYLYRLVMGEHQQIGVVACSTVDEYDADILRKHEKTRPDKEDDRTRHMVTLKAQTGPVFLTFRATDEIDGLMAEASMHKPLYDFTAPDGIRHTVWHAGDAIRFVSAFRSVPLLYIADGHHRAASASRARARELEQEARKVLETLSDRAQAELKVLLELAARGSREQLTVLGVELEKLGKKLQEIAIRSAPKAGSTDSASPPQPN